MVTSTNNIITKAPLPSLLSPLSLSLKKQTLELSSAMAARAALAAAARRAASLPSISSTPAAPSQAAKLIPRRGLAGGGDHHGPPKVNCWEDPLSPSKWKEEHFVIVSLTGWGLIFYGGYKVFSGGKKEKMEEGIAQSAH